MADKKRRFRNLTDAWLSALTEYTAHETWQTDAPPGDLPTLWDEKVFGLRIRIGRKRHSWSFYRERRFRGKRKYIFRRLGFFPSMGVADARKAALAHAAKISETHFDPGPRSDQSAKNSAHMPPHCPICARPMRLAKKTLRFQGLPELYTFECRTCDVSLTQERSVEPS